MGGPGNIDLFVPYLVSFSRVVTERACVPACPSTVRLDDFSAVVGLHELELRWLSKFQQ